MKRNLNVSILVDEDVIWSAVMGSAWEVYSWWRGLDFQNGATWESAGEGGRLSVLADSADNPYVAVTESVTLNRLFAAVESAMRDNVGAIRSLDWSDPDIDADLGDVIMQYAVFGEVIYG